DVGLVGRPAAAVGAHIGRSNPIDRRIAPAQRAHFRPGRLYAGRRRVHIDDHCVGPPVPAVLPQAHRSRIGGVNMEWILATAIGVLAGSGIWLLLRPRTFQFIMGLALLSY